VDVFRPITHRARSICARGALAAAVLSAVAAVVTPGSLVAFAAAEPCPDVDVIFARGTFEPPGVGVTGQAFIDALQARLASKNVEVSPVDYPASLDFTNGAGAGVADASTKVIDEASLCPRTKIVVGGYSQGAAVSAYITSDTLPANFPLPEGITAPLSPEVARHVAAVALFGKPSMGFLNFLVHDAPPINIGHLYAPKTIELCVPEDPVCSPSGNDQGAHGSYAANGMVDQAADFAAHAVARPA
jgi:cutinase-like protein